LLQRRNYSRLAFFILTLLLLLAGMPPLARGAGAAGQISVYLNDQRLWFDQPPLVEGGRVLVPLRVIFEALGATVDYEAATRKITAVKGTDTVELSVGSQDAYKNGVLKRLDVPAKVVGGRTLVPLRFVSEALGAGVNWDGKERKVSISAAGLGATEAPTFKDPLADVYFERVILSKLIMGPQGPVSVIPGSVFAPADSPNIDFTVKPAAPPNLKVTREVVSEASGGVIYEDPQELSLRPGGNGFSFPNPGVPGRYRLEVYSERKLLLVLPFEVAATPAK